MNLMNRHNLSTSSSDPAGVSGAAASSRTVRSTVFFLAKLCALFVALLFLFGKGIMPQYLYSYNASLLDKMERLTSLTEPKIVLISNSNLAFGMDCSLLEEAFQMPVVNAGVHGGLGNAFQEEIAKVNITEGDLIIVCHTDYDDDDTIVDPVIAWLTVENHPELWRLIRRKDIPDMYFSFPDYAKRVISLWTSKEGNVQDHGTVYSRLAFNEYGDVSFERPKPQYEKEEFFELFTLHAPAVGGRLYRPPERVKPVCNGARRRHARGRISRYGLCLHASCGRLYPVSDDAGRTAGLPCDLGLPGLLSGLRIFLRHALSPDK